MKKKLVLLPIIMLALAGCNNTNNSTPASEVDPATSTTPAPSTVVEPSTTPAPSTTEPIGAYQLVATHDFTTGTATGTELKTDTAVEVLNRNVTSGTSAISAVTATSKVYDGNQTGGIGDKTAGLLKFGTSSANGTITIKMTEGTNITKVVVNCHSFYKMSDSYPTNTANFVKVNDLDAVAAPYNDSFTGEDVEFELSSATDEITIASEGANGKGGRMYLFSVSFYTTK